MTWGCDIQYKNWESPHVQKILACLCVRVCVCCETMHRVHSVFLHMCYKFLSQGCTGSHVTLHNQGISAAVRPAKYYNTLEK